MQERERWAAHVQEIGILGMCYICKLSGRKELAGYDMESTGGGGGVMGMLGKFSLQFLTVLRGLGLFNVVYSENGLVFGEVRCDLPLALDMGDFRCRSMIKKKEAKEQSRGNRVEFLLEYLI